MTTRRRSCGASAAITLSLVAAVASGQAPADKSPWNAYGQLAGCSEEPAKFHPCALAKAKVFSPALTLNGRPDFSGFWQRARVTSHNIEEHVAGFGDPGGVSMIVYPPDGKIPYQSWAATQRAKNHATYIDPQALCSLPGIGRQAYLPGGFQIIQTAASVVFLYDYSHAYRVVPTDGRAYLPEGLRLATGHSAGHWEGNTLVVDISNVDDTTWLDDAGNFYSDAVHAVERWAMVDADAIHYEITFEDSKVYTRPWTMVFGIRRNKEPDYELIESACVEGDGRVEQGLRSIGLRPYPGVVPPK